MNLPVYFSESSKSKYLSAAQIEEFGAKVEAIRREVMESLNEKDAQYIYKIRNFVRYSEISARAMLMLQDGCLQYGFWAQVYWGYLKS